MMQAGNNHARNDQGKSWRAISMSAYLRLRKLSRKNADMPWTLLNEATSVAIYLYSPPRTPVGTYP